MSMLSLCHMRKKEWKRTNKSLRSLREDWKQHFVAANECQQTSSKLISSKHRQSKPSFTPTQSESKSAKTPPPLKQLLMPYTNACTLASHAKLVQPQESKDSNPQIVEAQVQREVFETDNLL